MIREFMNEESGQGMVEYGLIIALVAVVCIGAVAALGIGIGDKLTKAKDGLEGAGNANP